MSNGLFSIYCYGPADVLSIQAEADSLRLRLRNSIGQLAEAVYQGCVYWNLPHDSNDLHLSLVRKATAAELLRAPESASACSLRRREVDGVPLLHHWAANGVRFYLHYDAAEHEEYLIAAKKLIYQEFQ